MGTEFQAILVGDDPAYLRDAGAQALDEVERLEAQLSHYRPDSDVTDLNARAQYQAVRLEPLLYRLLRRAAALSAATEGAFDCAIGALIRCWGFFRGRGALAEESAVAEALERSGSRWLEFDDEARTLRFSRPGVEVHLGAIGKGYAVDRMVAVLREVGVQAALVHGGTSTLYALGAPPGEPGWSVGLCDPSERTRRLGVVRLRDRALSTSGDYEQFFEVAGRRYSHLLDPRTGFPAVGMRSATVAAESATDTDALSTAAFVLGLADGAGAREMLERFPGTGAILLPDTGSDGGRTVVVHGEIDVSFEDGGAGTRGEEIR